MTTEYFEQQIEEFKELGLLPKNFEITEIHYRNEGSHLLWMAIGCVQRTERKRLITSEDKDKKTLEMVRYTYKWERLFGKLRCRKNRMAEAERGLLAVRWNEITDRPETVEVLSNWEAAPDLDIREP